MPRTLILPKHREPTHPGEVLEEEFRIPYGLTQQQFADALGIDRVRYSEIARGRRSVTPNTALRLSRVLSTSVEMWLRMQTKCDLYRELHGTDAKAIKSLKPLELKAS